MTRKNAIFLINIEILLTIIYILFNCNYIKITIEVIMANTLIYIPVEREEFWKKIKEKAKKERRGVGFYICDELEKIFDEPEKESLV